MSDIQDCATCRFFLAKDEGSGGIGDCRRHAPLVTGGMMSNVETVWPQVGEAEWCGDHLHTDKFAKAEGETFVGGIRLKVLKCEHCQDGDYLPDDATNGTCPKCGADCIPF